MAERLDEWWRYPYAVAGPLSVLLWLGSAVVGTVAALTLRPSLQASPGAVVLGVGFLVLTLARRRFVKKRGITYYRAPRPRLKHGVAGALIALATVVFIASLHLSLAWYWPVAAVAALAYEIDRRRAWARLGWTGDPRWARNWSPEIDPVYDLLALGAMEEKDHAEARRLLDMVSIDDLGGWRKVAALYHLACIEAVSGEREAALDHLNAAFALDDHYVRAARKQAQKDPDLASIRDDPRFPAA